MPVRPAVAADVPAIEAVYVRSWTAAYAGIVPAERLADLAEVRRRRFDWHQGIADPGSTVLVGVDGDGVVAGVVQADGAVAGRQGRPELTMLYVAPAAWGTGLARRLHEAAVAWLAEQGHAEAWLQVVEDHVRARRFYEREGWVLDRDVPAGQTDLATLVSYRRVLPQDQPDGPGATICRGSRLSSGRVALTRPHRAGTEAAT